MPISFSSIGFEGIEKIVDAVDRAFTETKTDFYFVGAIARDVWMQGVYKKGQRLGTKDIDFAIFVPTEEQFEAVKTYLIDKENFTQSKDNAFTLFSPDRIQVDILPFEAIAVEGKVKVQGLGLSEIWVNGFREVFKDGVQNVEFENGKVFKVSTLPALIILKLIAYDDRPDQRQKDIYDVAYIIRYYLDIIEDVIFENHIDLVTDDYNGELAASRVLGREMYEIAKSSPELVQRMKNILHEQTNDPSNSAIGNIIAGRNSYETVQQAVDHLSAILAGFTDSERM